MTKLVVHWVKSAIGYPEDQRKTLRALGFRRLNQKVEHADLPSIQGMVAKVSHLVRVEKVDGE